MKRFLLFLMLMLIAVGASADDPLFSVNLSSSSPRTLQLRIEANDATNPQTFSYKTLTGVPAASWTAVAIGGTVTMKIHGYGGAWPYWWLKIPGGTTFTAPVGFCPLDSVIVLRDATTSGFYLVGAGKP